MAYPFDDFDSTIGLADPLDVFYRQNPMLRPEKPPSQGRAPARFQPLPPDEEKSLTDSILNTGIGGLQYLGETIGKPGRIVRGLLGGDLREGLGNLIPFSDLAGITDPSKQVSGRSLLESAGILSPNEAGLDAGDIGGFAAEVALDPLTYLTLGASALGKSGAIAKAAGVLPKTRLGRITGSLAKAFPEGADIAPEVASAVAEAAGKRGAYLASDLATKLPSKAWTEPLGGLFGARIPFSGAASYIPDIATGPVAQSIAGGLDVAGSTLRSLPPIRALGGLFDYRKGGVFDKHQQQAAEYATEAWRSSIPKAELGAMKAADDVAEVTKAFHESFGDDIEKLLPQHAGPTQVGGFSVGDVVRASDRQNYGKIVGFSDDGPIVHFVSPDGVQATVPLGMDEISHAFSPGSKEAIDAAAELKMAGTRSLIGRAVQLAAEIRNAGKPDVEGALGRILPGINITADLKQQLADVTGKLIDAEDATANAIKSMGGKISMMFENQGESPVGHFGRFWAMSHQGPQAEKLAILKKSWEAALARNPNSRYVDTNALNKMLEDPELLDSFSLESGVSSYKILDAKYGDSMQRAAAAATQKAREEFAKSPDTVTPLARKALNQLGYNDSAVDSMKVADAYGYLKAAGVDPTQVTVSDIQDGLLGWLEQKQGVGQFTEDAVKNFARYQRGGEIAKANLAGIHSMFKDNLVPTGGMPLDKAFKHAGMTDEAVGYFSKQFGTEAAAMGVHPDAVAAAKSFMEKTGNPEWFGKLGKWVDLVTQPMKRHRTLPFISFLTRNLAGGQAMNFMSNEIGSFADARAYWKELKAARRFLSDPKSAKNWIDEAVAYGVLQKGQAESLGVELSGGGMHEAGLPNPITGRGLFQSLKEGADVARQHAYNPPAGSVSELLNRIPGFKQTRAVLTTPAEVGSKLNHQVEWMNRLPMYMYLRNRLGWSAETAAQKVRQLQVAYEELAPFEKEVMRRMVPFYSWTRKIVPVMLKQIAERPGGVTAQAIRLSNVGRGQGEFVPPYVGEGMSVPLGKDTYISQLGLPTDQFSDLLVFGPSLGSTVKRTGQKLMSQMNPILKAPIELGTGINLFAGRPQEELHAFPTQNKFVNTLLHETPASRYMTTTRKLLDPRPEKSIPGKLLNLLTGVQTTTVSGGLEKEMQLATRKINNEILREFPQVGQHTSIYLRPGETATPELEKYLRLNATLEKRRREQAKKRKELAK